MNFQFKKPDLALQELKEKYTCSRVLLLKTKLSAAKNKSDSELFFGALFAEALNKISKHQYLIRMPEKDEECDIELLDHSEWQSNQKLPKDKKTSDHFLLQNVQITEHAVASELKKENNNIYEIFKQHLHRTKLSSMVGDYSGCILVFYLNLKINGLIDLREFRVMIRSVKQDKFQQIWIIIPNDWKYGIAELCHSEEQFRIADFEN